MSNEIQDDVILDDKFFKEKAYHKGITIIATVGCKESHIKKTINCLSHIQNLFEKKKSFCTNAYLKIFESVFDRYLVEEHIPQMEYLVYKAIQYFASQ